MTLFEWMTFGGTMATVLGIFVGFCAMINNRVIKSEMAANRMLLEKIEQGQERIALGQEKIAMGQEDFKKSFTEAMKYLGDLIVADGERTRRVIGQS